MSLPPSRAVRVPGPSGSLCALLALLLLTPPGPLASAGPAGIGIIVQELRCKCLNITPTVRPKMISNLEVIAAGPQCSKVEIIAFLKNGRQICLDPDAPLVKKIIQKILDSGKKN